MIIRQIFIVVVMALYAANRTGGLDAQGEAVVEVEYDGRSLSGRGLNTNVIEASAQAFLQVVNRIALRQVRPRLKPTDHVPQETVPTL